MTASGVSYEVFCARVYLFLLQNVTRRSFTVTDTGVNHEAMCATDGRTAGMKQMKTSPIAISVEIYHLKLITTKVFNLI